MQMYLKIESNTSWELMLLNTSLGYAIAGEKSDGH